MGGSTAATRPLLEREAELGVLRARIGVLRDEGAGGAVLVEGPPGIGKSALLATAVDGLAGITVLRARANELEAGLAFGGVRQLFAASLRELAHHERARILNGPAALAAPVLGLS